MSTTDVRKAAAMLSGPHVTKAEVAKHFGLSRVTLNSSLARARVPDSSVAPKQVPV